MKTKFSRILTSILMVFAFGFSVQSQSISGTVTDDNGVPLPMEFLPILMEIIQ